MQYMGCLGGLMLTASALVGADRFYANPNRIEMGKTTTIAIVDGQCKPDDPLATANIRKPTTTGVAVDSVVASKCILSAAIKVDATAPYGDTYLTVYQPEDKDKKQKDSNVAIVRVEVVAVIPGATPEGIREVDLMWKVLPYRSVADSFGKRVAQKYFYIEVTLGNNSGYPLLIENVGFLAATERGGDKEKAVPWPNDSYPLARSTIEKEQQIGKRSLVLNSLTAAFSIAAASSGFVTHVRTKADYGLWLGLASPITTGMELIWPDKTIRHMLAMDSRTFRGGMVIQNNASRSFSVFISREMIECGFKKDTNCKETCSTTNPRIPYVKDFNPQKIFNALAPLVIVGNQIEYKQRMRVASRDVPESRPTAPVIMALSREERTLTAGADPKQILLVGSGLTDVVVTPAADSKIKVHESISDSRGQSLRLKLSAEKDATPKCYPLVISTPVPPPATLDVCVEAAAPKTSAKQSEPAKAETSKPQEASKPESPKPEAPKPREAKPEKKG